MMTKKLIALTLSMSALLLASASAQAADQVEVRGRALHVLTPDEAASLQGRYALADGRTIEVTRVARRVSAVFAGHEVPLLALSPTRLQSADGALTLHFDAAANGSVRGVTLTVATAQAAGPTAPVLAALAAPARAPGR